MTRNFPSEKNLSSNQTWRLLHSSRCSWKVHVSNKIWEGGISKRFETSQFRLGRKKSAETSATREEAIATEVVVAPAKSALQSIITSKWCWLVMMGQGGRSMSNSPLAVTVRLNRGGNRPFSKSFLAGKVYLVPKRVELPYFLHSVKLSTAF